jgi:methyl-accepting chemotaxis protein
VVEGIHGFTGTIAGAVGVQSAATQDIASNIQHAAAGAHELFGNIDAVTQAIQETNRCAAAVLEVSSALSSQSQTLQKAFDVFLRKVAA